MEKIIEIPNDVQIELNGFKVKVTGPKGTLERDFYSPLFRKEVVIKRTDNKISISSENERKKIKAMIGTMASHIFNMIVGVREGFVAKLKIVYMHFPFTVKTSGKEVLINNFLGEKTPRRTKIVGDCKVEIKEDEITVTGIDKEEVGETVSNLEKSTWVSARDRRVFQDGLFKVK